MDYKNFGSTGLKPGKGWLRQQPGVTSPIIGASKAQQLADAVQALGLTLAAEELTQLQAAYVPHPIVGQN